MATIYHQGDPDLIFTRHNDRDHLIRNNEHKYKTKRLEEIEKSLEQDRKRLSSITEALERNDKLTMRMESIFLSLTGRLESIENKFMTIYEESGRLKQLNLTLEHLDPVIGHYQAIETTVSIMSQGPTGRLKEYLCCLDRIKRATDYFEEVIPEGPELKALRVSQNSAKKQLLSEFKRLLLKCCKPASPIAILNLIDGEEVLGTQKENLGIPGPVLQDMASISAWFLEDYSSLDYLLEDTEEPRKSAKKLKTQSLDRDVCGGSPKKKRITSWLSNKLKTCSLDRPPTLGPLPYSKEESPLHELPDITEEEFPLTMENSPSRLKTRSLDRLESPNTFKAPFPGSPFTRKTASWKKGKMKILSLERHPGFVPVHAQSVSNFVEVIEEDSFSASKRQSAKNLKTQSLDRDTCGGSPKKKRIASWLSNKLKTRSLDRPPTLGPLPHSREESPLHELPDITEEEFPLTMESSPSRLKTQSLDRLESPNTFKAPFPGSPFTRMTTSWKKGKMKILSLERHPNFLPVRSQSVSNLLEDIEEDSLSASKLQSAKNLKTQSLDRDTCGGSPKKKRIASWLSNKLKTRSLDRPPTLGPLPYSREEFPLHELSDFTEDEFPLTMASSPSGLKTRSLDRLMSPNTFKAPFPGSPFTRKTMSWKKGKIKTRSLERHPGFVPVQRVFIFTVYSEARSCHMHQSLKDFRDHLRMRSASSTSSLNSLSSASSSWSLSSSSPSSLSSFRGTLKRFFNRLGKNDWCDIDVDCFSQCLKAFSLLAGVEFSALAEVFPEHYWKRTFDPLVQQALDLLTEEGEYIIFAARQAVNVHHNYGPLLMVLRAHDTLKVTQPSIDTVLEHTSNKTRNKLPNLIKSMGNFARQAMEKYSSTILDEWNKKKEMPEDGTVHELTSNVILFLSKLMQSRSTADLFTSREPGNGIQDCESADDDITCLRPFISEVLEQLFLSLDDMASTYKDPYLKAIYLFNNYNYIHKSMSRAPLRCVVWEGGAGEAQATWERRAEEQKQKYLQSWLAVAQHLKDDGIVHVQPGSKLQEKERHLIKGKFQSFNASLEELIRVQGEWAISDPEQREALSRAQAYGVGQAYRAFLQRYEQVKFTTKHPQKYYKYTTREVEEMITSFFDSLI